jgi:hypothetical protein
VASSSEKLKERPSKPRKHSLRKESQWDRVSADDPDLAIIVGTRKFQKGNEKAK